ncbi:MAG: prepilin-type N-terminal cleavage/methylation domain-containing protein [Candidatus Omnitrophica bacterium]|nr:prepilin-type N-terminal cleavage/methylation domain-containing protein [Candidatus Omnitrophota bacterium]MBU4148882.1 prepilin-type N-terminal cleavage/methylation domain-containing protein [Candidatus Omnitrophota bacterium]
MRRTGLTFIELMIGIAILSVAMLTVYGVFSIGLKIWHRSHAERALQDVRLAFLKIDKEMKNTFFFSEIPFKGSEDKVTFPVSVNEGEKQKLYVVSYVIKNPSGPGLKELAREERYFSERAYESSDMVKVRTMVGSLKSARFEYAYSNASGYEWLPYWDGTGQGQMPSGVRISLEIENDFYNKVIFLQHGKLGVR